jgi:hypothetical protein
VYKENRTGYAMQQFISFFTMYVLDLPDHLSLNEYISIISSPNTTYNAAAIPLTDLDHHVRLLRFCGDDVCF